MKRRAAGVCLALVLGACRTEPRQVEAPEAAEGRAPSAPASSPVTSPSDACAAAAEPAVCADSVERELIAASESVRRSGDTLWITGADGSTLLLVTGLPAGIPMSFRYAGFLSGLGHGIEVGHYEGSEFLLVDSVTTQQTTLIGRPVLSPDRTRFAAASLDLVAGYNPNGMQIWELREGGPAVEWELRGGSSWGASNPRWIDESTLDFTLHRPLPDPDPTAEAPMRITIGDASLHVDPLAR